MGLTVFRNAVSTWHKINAAANAAVPCRIVATQSLAQLGSCNASSHGVVRRLSKWIHELEAPGCRLRRLPL